MMFLAYLFCALALADQPASEPASADKKTAAASDNKALTKTVNEASFKPPSPSFIPPPVYPEAAIAEGLSGSVLMAIDNAADGSVVAVEVLEADREDFAQAALDNARSSSSTSSSLCLTMADSDAMITPASVACTTTPTTTHTIMLESQ